MTVDLGAARRTFTSYRGASFWTRAFVAARLVVAPLGSLGDEARPLCGRMLSLGSGFGIVERYLAEMSPNLAIEGLDLDTRKVELIRATAARSPRVVLREADVTLLDEPAVYDAVLACDVMHHLEPATHPTVAAAVVRCLRPGGVCLVKDLDVRPRWKYEWNRLHDRLVAGPEPIFCRSPDDMAATFASAGLIVERAVRTDRRLTPYAHYLLRLRKPA